MLILFGDKIRSQTKPFLYLFQLVGAKDPVHEYALLRADKALYRAKYAGRNRTVAIDHEAL